MADNIILEGVSEDAVNIYKALAGANIELRKGQGQAALIGKIFSDIEKSIQASDTNQRKLFLTNLQLEASLKRVVKMEDAKLNQTRRGADFQAKLKDAYDGLEVLYREQINLQNQITKDNKKQNEEKKIEQAIEGEILTILTKQLGVLGSTANAMITTGSLIFTMLKLSEAIVKVFGDLDAAAFEFRKSMGITRQFTSEIDEYARDGATNMAQLGVSGKEMYEAATGISKALFSSSTITKEMMDHVALLSATLNVSAESSAELLKTLAMTSRSTASTQQDALLFATGLSDAAGTPLKDVMEDISKTTMSMYQFVSKSGVSMIKAAVEARKMGTTIESSVKSSASLLNFTQNVKDEMEASVLVGKSIDLQRARELAYHSNISGLNKEILKIMKDVNFEQLDSFQQEAVARALGKSAGELGQMAQAERQRLNFEKEATPKQKEQYEIYKKMLKTSQDQLKVQSASVEKRLTDVSNQKRLNNITFSWNKILMQLSQTFLPLIDKGLAKMAEYIIIISKGIDLVGVKWGRWAKAAAALTAIFLVLVGTRGIGKLIAWATGSVGKAVDKLFGGVAGGVSKFGTAGVLKGALGMILIAGSLFIFAKALQQLKNFDYKAIALGLLVIAGSAVLFGAIAEIAPEIGLAAIAIGLVGLAFMAFAKAAQWGSSAIQGLANVEFGKIFVGLNSLSLAITPLAVMSPLIALLGLSVSGLGIALKLLGNPAEKVGNSMKNLGEGMKSVVESLSQLKNLKFVETIIQLKNLTSAIKGVSDALNNMPNIKVEKLRALSYPSTPAGGTTGAGGDKKEDVLSDIRDAIKGLRDDMKAGTLTANVYIDSQKLDALMGRRLAYTGNLV